MGLKTKIFGFFVVLALLLICANNASASQPYIGGYLSGSADTTSKVVFDVNYADTNVNDLPDNKFLAGALSVAGGSGTTPSGWVYQNGVALFNTNKVYWIPQSWCGTSQENSMSPVEIGTGDYVAYYERIDITASEAEYRAYVYEDFQDYEYDSPTIYTLGTIQLMMTIL